MREQQDYPQNSATGVESKSMKRLNVFIAGAMFALPGATSACACCGVDDSWRVETVAPDSYGSDVVRQLRLGPGRFRISGDDEWSIAGVEHVGDSFAFRSEIGEFKFSPRGLSEHRIVDVTFITQPQYQLVDSADIYHEITLTGVLALPKHASKHFGRTTLDATVVLRGVGNMCWHVGTFSNWLISVRTHQPFLIGSGVMSTHNQHDVRSKD